METETAIVGAGLSGLALAQRLQDAGRDYVLIEAADRVGGRILTREISGLPCDLGPAWIWPGQPRVANLLRTVDLEVFEQWSTGNGLFETADGRVQHAPGAASMRGSWRIAGGIGALSAGLARRLDTQRVRTGTTVTRVSELDDALMLETTGEPVRARRVVLAIPPRIVEAHIRFSPPLSQDVMSAMRDVPTWMAGHAKFIAVYDRAHWREAGFSGDAISQRGPLAEIHDASASDGSMFALFGFSGVPVRARTQNPDAFRAAALDQFTRLFGPRMSQPKDILFQDWAQNPLVATEDDHAPLMQHPAYGMPPKLTGHFADRLRFASSETAPDFGGFIEGALEASEAAATWLDV